MIDLGSRALTIADVEAVAMARAGVALSEGSVPAIERSRALIARILDDPAQTVYGVNTGFGSLKDVRIDNAKVEALQLNLIRSHAVGVGPALPKDQVRAMMLLRAATLTRGHSGVARATVDLLLRFLAEDVVPVVPSLGSVGASGDLAPLSHLALCLVGEGKVLDRGEVRPTAAALQARGMAPLRLGAKEALALINGTQMMTALGCLHLARARRVARAAHAAAALTVDASLGSARAFDPRVHALRPHAGQRRVAAALRSLLEGSAIMASHAGCGRVQDAYSLRCAPQVHGVAEDAMDFAARTLETEVNSVTDNPLLFADTGEFVSAGNFHGQPVSFAMDALAIALTSLAAISERRTFRLLSPSLSELPTALVGDAGLQSGLMMLQVTSAALVSECKVLAHPASVDSIPTWAEQEDHVSMGPHAARKLGDVVAHVARVVAAELVCAVQGLGFRRPLCTTPALETVAERVTAIVPRVTVDRPLGDEVEALAAEIAGESFLAGLETHFREEA